MITVINDLLLFNPFQPCVVFPIETVVRFPMQIMSDFFMEWYTGLKWVKREYSLPQILNLSLLKCFWGRFVNRTQNSSKNFTPFWRLRFGRGSLVRPPSNGEELRDIQHIMSMVLDTRFDIWLIMTVNYKMRQILVKNATAILL